MNSKKQKTFINITIFTLTIGGVFYFMNHYLFNYIRSMSNEVVAAKKDVVLIAERNKKIDEVRSNYNNIEKEIGVISDTFVKKDNEKFGEMFMELEDIAHRYNIELTKDPASKAEERMGDGIFAAYFNMTAKGEYDDLMKFVLYLDNFKYYIDLNNIEIIRSSDDENSMSKMAMRAELEVYLENKQK